MLIVCLLEFQIQALSVAWTLNCGLQKVASWGTPSTICTSCSNSVSKSYCMYVP